jgi:hypothetical protein
MGKEVGRLGWLERGGLIIVNYEAQDNLLECARHERAREKKRSLGGC